MSARSQISINKMMSTDIYADRTFPAVLGFGAGLAVLQGVFDYTGAKFTGYDRDPQMDEYARKEALRANKRRPIQETLSELGEGRGIHIIALGLPINMTNGARRNIRTRLQGATSGQDKGGLWD